MGGLDPAKILIILVLALVLVGPERLPKVARQAGAFFRDFAQWRQRIEDEVRGALPDLDLPRIPTMPKRGITSYLTGMMLEADGRATAGGDRGGENGDGEGGAGPEAASWQSSSAGQPDRGGSLRTDTVVVPNGVPASWSATGADLPGYASGSALSPMPSAVPEAVLGISMRLDFDDPGWN